MQLQAVEINLKMGLRRLHPQNLWPILTLVAVAEWSKASDHFRLIGEKLRWGLGTKIFFFAFFDGSQCRYDLVLHHIQIWRKIIQKI